MASNCKLNFRIYCTADTVDDGGYAQMSGCGIITIYEEYITKFGYALGPTSNKVAKIKAIKLGVLSINKKYRNDVSNIEIYGDPDILILLSDGIEVQRDIAKLVAEVRDLIRPFANKTSFIDETDAYYQEAFAIARQCQESQRNLRI